MSTLSLPVVESSGAEFSPCRTHRYALWRNWDWQGYGRRVMFIGLNPSTADETKNDLTISKCIGFAKRWGYGGITMMNLFAYRSTDPAGLLRTDNPIGSGNLEAFGYRRSQVGLIVAAWGSLPAPWKRQLGFDRHVERVVQHAIMEPIYCLGTTADGSPRHPSRLGYDAVRELWWTPSAD
jgi:hypothetical protein